MSSVLAQKVNPQSWLFQAGRSKKSSFATYKVPVHMLVIGHNQSSLLSVLVYEEKEDFGTKMLSVNQARFSGLVSVRRNL